MLSAWVRRNDPIRGDCDCFVGPNSVFHVLSEGMTRLEGIATIRELLALVHPVSVRRNDPIRGDCDRRSERLPIHPPCVRRNDPIRGDCDWV